MPKRKWFGTSKNLIRITVNFDFILTLLISPLFGDALFAVAL
jgi:hypothetical protein